MKKTLLLLSVLVSLLIGFVAGFAAATRYWINPRQEFLKLQAEAFTVVQELSDLRSSNTAELIQSKERQLDTCIVALGGLAKEAGPTANDAIQSLRRIAEYRKHVDYASNGVEAQKWVNDSLKLANPAP